MELSTIKNESMVSTVDPIAPLTVPISGRPVGDTVSSGNAALLAESAASDNGGQIGILSPTPKNLVFVGLVLFIIWKYGRKVLNA